MAKVIEQGHRAEGVRYSRSFNRVPYDGSGFSFDATPDGDVLLNWEFVEGNAESWLHVQEELKAGRLVDKGLRVDRWTYWVNTVIECECGDEVELYSSLCNTCDKCGRDYNASGMLLAPRSQWESSDLYGTFGPQNFGEDYDGDY